MSYKKENLTERVIFRISKKEKVMIDSILKKGIYKSQSELFRGAMGSILFFEEKISLSEINLYLRGKMADVFAEIEAIEEVNQFKETQKEFKKQYQKMYQEIEKRYEKRELDLKEYENMIREKTQKYENMIREKTQKYENMVEKERNVTIKMMIKFIDILNKIPAGMKRRKLDFTEEGKLVKSLFINTKNQLEKLFLFYLRDSSKMSQKEIDELFKENN